MPSPQSIAASAAPATAGNRSPLLTAQTETATRRWPFAHRCSWELLGGGGRSCRGGTRLGVAGEVLLDARLLAFQAAQVVQLAGADGAAALDLDRVDGRAVRLEHALDAVAVRDLAHGEGGVEAGVLLADDHALVSLDALAVAFLDLDVDHDGVAGAEVRQLALRLFVLEILQQRVERGLVHDDDLGCLPVGSAPGGALL